MRQTQPFSRVNSHTGQEEFHCLVCGYLPPEDFQAANIKIHKALCATCSRAQCRKRYNKRTVLERLRVNLRTRLLKFGLKAQADTMTVDMVRDILELNGINVKYSTKDHDFEYQHLHLYPPRSIADFNVLEKWTVIIMDEYYRPKRKRKKAGC